MHELTHKVLDYIQRHELLKPGDRVGVAVSGGADSVALLRLLLELRKALGVVISVVHFNHKLRGAESDGEKSFVAELARCRKLQFYSSSGNVAGHAAKKHMSVETAARELRYEFFRSLVGVGAVRKPSSEELNGPQIMLDKIATGHTLDDQAETVLMRLVRGAGTRGLAGIYPKLAVRERSPQHSALSTQPDRESSVVSSQSCWVHAPFIVRPLLNISRTDLECYLAAIGQDWREDSSNRDLRFTRNRVRYAILPRLERYLNPAVRHALSETAEIARGEEEYWQDEVARLMESAWSSSSPGKSYAREACDSKKETVTSGGALRIDVLRRLPLALQRRLVRSGAELLGLRLEFQHLREILRLSESGPKSGPKSAPLPHDWKVVRTGEELRFQPPLAGETEDAPTEYEYSLCVPGRVEVPETSSMFEAVAVGMGNSMAGYNPDHLFDPAALSKELQVRNWRPGDRFWPAHTKCPKKIKELLQTHHITLEERKLWPVVVSGEEIVWVRGFPAARRFLPKGNAREAMLIREVPLASV